MSVVRRRPEVVAKFKTAFLTRNGTSQSIFGVVGRGMRRLDVLPYRHNGKIQVARVGESSFWSLCGATLRIRPLQPIGDRLMWRWTRIVLLATAQ
jgi:hypothetical protein